MTHTHAYVGNRGLPISKSKKKGWVDAALADLAQQTHIEVVVPGNEDEEWVTAAIPIAEWWRDTIATLVDKIWVNDDGSLTIEGVITLASGEVSASTSPQ